MRRSNDHSTQDTRFATKIAALAKMPDIRSLERGALDVVMVLRYCALCDQAGRDPLADLATHFGSGRS